MTTATDQSELGRKIRQLEKEVARLRRAEARLDQCRGDLIQTQKMESLGRLVAGVAHEINNPINLILFNIPMFREVWHDVLPVLEASLPARQGKTFGRLSLAFLKDNMGQLLADSEMAARRVATVVKNLKNFYRQSDLADREIVQVNTAVDNAVRLVRTTARKAGVLPEMTLAEDLPHIEGHQQSLEQVLVNIMLNAVEAIEHPQGKLTIETFPADEGDSVAIAVSDNGRGIDADMVPVLFDPFVTDKQDRGGTGLGLYISRSLVQAMDGRIDFGPNQPRGTTFTVTLPARSRQPGPRILVIDDDDAIRRLLIRRLTRNRPYRVDEAANGVEACVRLGSSRPDLAILDIHMPEVDGLEVCRIIRRDPALSDLKVIITTGHPGDPKVRGVQELGFTEIFYKPIDLTQFMVVIDKMLESNSGEGR